ncbi:MAG: DUF6506 family protein [Bacillota bacterium]|nr:DUF6506 family protein [Bacillota bacterium]
MKKYAFIIWGKPYNYDPTKDVHSFTTEHQTTTVVTVTGFEEAVDKARELVAEGYGALELCGAFGKEKAAELSAAIQGKASVGYVYYEPEEKQKVEEYFRDFGKPSQ